MNKQVLPTIYSTAFWCLFVVLLFFFFSFIAKLLLLLSQNEVKAGHFNLSGSWTIRNKNVVFFSPKFKSAANFSAPAEEGNLFFLSGRSARKKIHNFPIKSSHLCRTSRHVWLSSSACDHCLLRLPTNLHLKLETLLWWQLALTRRVQGQKWWFTSDGMVVVGKVRLDIFVYCLWKFWLLFFRICLTDRLLVLKKRQILVLFSTLYH